MIEKIVKTRKNHVCDSCGKVIPMGEKCLLMRGKDPVIKDEGYYATQIGIKYWESRTCFLCFMEPVTGEE